MINDDYKDDNFDNSDDESMINDDYKDHNNDNSDDAIMINDDFKNDNNNVSDDDGIDDELNDDIHLNISDYLSQKSEDKKQNTLGVGVPVRDSPGSPFEQSSIGLASDFENNYAVNYGKDKSDYGNYNSNNNENSSKDDFETIRSRLNNIDYIMYGLHDKDNDLYKGYDIVVEDQVEETVDEVEETENELEERIMIQDCMHYGGIHVYMHVYH